MKLKLLKLVRFFHLINKEKYNEKRQIEIVKKSPLFNKKWYLAQNPDVKSKKMGAAKHYVKHGWKEDRNPSLEFNGFEYLEICPDVKNANICPLVHYEISGKKENRIIKENRKLKLINSHENNIANINISEIKKQISKKEIKYISFDIFDTLLMRPTIDPKDIFFIIAKKVNKQYNVDFVNIRQNAEELMNDNNASLDDIYKFIQNKYQIEKSIIDILKKEEIDCEKQLLFAREDGRKLYEYAVKCNKKIIATSDMYLSSKTLIDIMKNKGYDISEVFVSNEYKARKSNGKLFDILLQKLRVKPSEILHIGDNYESDYKKPKDVGIQVAHLPSIMDIIKKHKIYSHILKNNINNDPMVKILLGFSLNYTYSDSDKQSISNFKIFPNLTILSSTYLSPLLFYIVTFILQNKNIQQKYKKVFFASRDGYLPQKIYELLRPLYSGLPSEYLYAGRRAYYMARGIKFFDYLKNISIAQSYNYTLKNLIDCYIIDKKLNNEICDKLSDNELQTSFLRDREKCLGYLKQFSTQINKHINTLKKNTMGYYSNKVHNKKNIIFDVGYGGSISDALTQITKKTFDKIYLWQNDNNIKLDKKNATKTFLLFKDNFYYPLEAIILEELFSPLSGTCIGFNDKDEPILEETSFSQEMQQDIKLVEATCVNFFNKIQEVFGNYLSLLTLDDVSILRNMAKYAFYQSEEFEEQIFCNIKFADSVFYGNTPSLYEKIKNNNGKNYALKKILLISNEMSYSGAPHSLLRMCKILKEKYKITVWTLKTGNFEKEFAKYNISVEKVSENDFYSSYIINEIKKYDLAICNTILTEIPCKIIEQYIPCIWYIREAHNIPNLLNSTRKQLLETQTRKGIYCVSEYAQEFIEKNYNCKINVCHNCVEDLNDGYIKKFYKKRKLTMAVIGNFEPRKEFITAINAIKSLPLEYHDKVELSLVGRSYEGNYSKSIFDTIKNMTNIKYIGEIADINEKINLYKNTDIVIVPSTDESCSLVALEAIMMGCPIIVSRNVGAQYVVDKNTGWIFETGNVIQLKNIIQNIADKKYNLSLMSMKAREKYLQTSNMDIYKNNILRMVDKFINNNKTSKILIHLHLYYEEQLAYFLGKLANITDCNYDLYVTSPKITNKAIKEILKFSPTAKIIKTHNIGYDVWPFIQLIKNIDLNQYDFIMKLHTKAFQTKPNRLGKTGMWWRNELVDTLLADKKQFIKNIYILKQQDDIGMICSSLMLREVSGNKDIPEESFLLNKELCKLKFITKSLYYCAGTMFIAKTDIFKFLKSLPISEKDFTGKMSTHGSGTLAHVYERILGIATFEKGYKIYPQKHFNIQKEIIPIVYASDNNYMLPTIVSICSLIENKDIDTIYEITILHTSTINKRYIKNIKNIVNKAHCFVNFINMKDLFKNASSQIEHISVVTYYRLLLPSLLKKYNKCIWLDGDTIICKDLSELYNISLEKYFLAGVLAPYSAKDPEYCKTLGIAHMKQYVNAGVILWNLKEMRENGLEDKFLKLVTTDFKMMDQDILNKVCFDKIKLLPLRYNVMNKLYQIEEKELSLKKQLYTNLEYEEAFSSPVIIHFCDKIKPWNSSKGVFFDIWDEYKKTSEINNDNFIEKIKKYCSKLYLNKSQPSRLFSINKYGNKKVYRVLGLKFAFNNFKKDVLDNQEKILKMLSDIQTRQKKIESEIKELKNK